MADVGRLYLVSPRGVSIKLDDDAAGALSLGCAELGGEEETGCRRDNEFLVKGLFDHSSVMRWGLVRVDPLKPLMAQLLQGTDRALSNTVPLEKV